MREAGQVYQGMMPDLQPLLARCGNLAREQGVRLSFHPGQYTVLASDNPDVVARALEDVEYHALCARWLGYGRVFQDFKINIHMNGKRGIEGLRASFQRLSPEARNMLTVETDEISCSLDDVLPARHLCPVVLAIHHHWVKEDQYIQANDARIPLIIESWRGVRPMLHYSIAQEGIIPEQGFPHQQDLAVSKMKLRAHADYYFNQTLNDWALSFSDFDIMCEVKMNNLARDRLYHYSLSRNAE